MLSDDLRFVATQDELLEVGRKAIEDRLVELRDSRIGLIGRGNGLVIRESDGTESKIIRMAPEHALTVALEAMADFLERK